MLIATIVFYIALVASCLNALGPKTFITLLVSETSDMQFTDPLVLYILENQTSSFCQHMRDHNVISGAIYEVCLDIISDIEDVNLFSIIRDEGQYVNEVFVAINEHTVASRMSTMLIKNYTMVFHDEVSRTMHVHAYSEWDEVSSPKFLKFLFNFMRTRKLQSLRSGADPFRHCTDLPVEVHGETRSMFRIPYNGLAYDYTESKFTPFCTSYREIGMKFCELHEEERTEDLNTCSFRVAEAFAEYYDGPAISESNYLARVARYHPRRNRVAFITAIFGNFEMACKRHKAQNMAADFICFSDNPSIEANGWEVDASPYHLSHPSPLDTGEFVNSISKNNHSYNLIRYYKQAFRNIPRMQGYDIVVWVDGSLELTEARATEQLSLVLEEGQCALGLWNHTIRPNLEEEVRVTRHMTRYCSLLFNNQSQPFQDVAGQFREYLAEEPRVNEVGVWYTTLVAYNMKRAETVGFLDMWYLESLRHTSNCQVSFPFVALNTQVPLCTFPNDVLRGRYPNQQTSIFIKHLHGL